MKERVLLSWSGGKDAALALHQIPTWENFEVAALLTTVTQEYDRISMHGVRRVLLERQAVSLGLPLEIVFISKTTSNEEYGRAMQQALEKYLADGVSSVAFGDVFLEDVRKYREENLATIGMEALFPLWKRDTTELAHTFIDLGYEAVVTCVDSELLDGAFVGRTFDRGFVADLPPDVDPCGENGEFHSFVHAGPIFDNRISYKRGEVVLRDGRFYYCDLIPV
ncbi:MAG: ATP-binding protein [Chloroflexi bacterium B3_Chlor]|nr:MAG: ATP-binding protein [Chloroflexi bacterium B3_Chlor]